MYNEQQEDLEDLFWETFRSHVSSLNPAQERGITVARLTGLFFRHAFKFNLYAIPKDNSWDLRLLDGQLLGDRQWLTRAHPITVRIALNQLRQLPSFQEAKSFNSRRLQEVLKKIPFLTLPEFDSNSEQRTCPAWYAFWIRFKSDLAPAGLTRTDFVQLLKSAGLDVDTPNSTRPLYKEPLFTHPEKVLPGIYASAPLTQPPSTSFPMADSFHRELIKMPVCVMSCQQATADFYLETLSEIATKYVEFSP